MQVLYVSVSTRIKKMFPQEKMSSLGFPHFAIKKNLF